jgi:uncharacterized membrane protein YidH (DUF202 family)
MYYTATALASVDRSNVTPYVLSRLDLIVIILAGLVITDAVWRWMRRQ